MIGRPIQKEMARRGNTESQRRDEGSSRYALIARGMPGLRRPQRAPKLMEEESGVLEPEEHMCSWEAGKHFYVSSFMLVVVNQNKNS